MKILLLSKACLVGAYQRKLEEIAAHPDVELTVVVPPEWRDERGVLKLEREHTQGYQLIVESIRFNGSFHLHFYPGLGRRIAEAEPHIVHIDEEPYNLATFHALRLAKQHGARALFFSWQNIVRRYPFPFSWFERAVLRCADFAIVGNREAAAVWRGKGYGGPVAVIPQFGVDPKLFAPRPLLESRPERSEADFIIGYAGRFVEEKGVDVLLRAAARLDSTARLRLLGSGPARAGLERLAHELGLGERVTFEDWLPSNRLPNFLRQLDALVAPSRTRPHWKEQFGRVIVEAMACGVPVVGSTCGEIPNVIGEAGLIFPEGDAAALAECLRQLQRDPPLRTSLAEKGRARVLARYTQQRIAAETVAVYRRLFGAVS